MTDEMTLNAAAVGRKTRFSDRWSAKDLVVIGIFAAAAQNFYCFNRHGGRRDESCFASA